MNYPVKIISGFKPKYSDQKKRFVPGAQPFDADMFEEVLRIRDGYYKEKVLELREITDPGQYDLFKGENLVAFTFAARFKGWRMEANMVEHSGYINIDVDGKHNPHMTTVEHFAEARDAAFQSKHVVASWLSAGSLGYTFIVYIGPGDKAHHKRAFMSIKDDLAQAGIALDAGCFNLDRLRYVSYDPDAKIKTPEQVAEMQTYVAHDVAEEEKPKPAPKPSTGTKSKVNNNPDTFKSFSNCIKKAESFTSFGDGTKHFFLTKLAGYANAVGMSQEYVEANVLATYGPQTDITDDRLLEPIRNVYKTYSSQHGVVIAKHPKSKDVFAAAHMANRAGLTFAVQDLEFTGQKYDMDLEDVRAIYEKVYTENEEEHGIDKKPEITKVEFYLKQKYEFARNIVSTQKEFRLKGSDDDYQLVNEAEIWRELQAAGFKFDLGKVKALLDTDFATPYDPFKKYFEELPEWDGKTDYITEFADYLEAEDQEFFRIQFKKALVRSIACSVDHIVNRIVFVLVQQKQEAGKSTWIRYLNPWGERYITESAMRDNKDAEFKFSENFMYNMEELASLNNTEVNRLKGIISKKFVKERKPFAVNEKEQFRRCNFWASTNKTEFLTDTENTRWLCIKIKRVVSFDYGNEDTGVKKVDINKVWSQAYSLYKSGYKYNLDDEDKAKRDAINKEFEVSTSERELIIKYLTPAPDKDQYFQTITDIQSKLVEIVSNRIKITNIFIAKAMDTAGFIKATRKLNGMSVKGYYVKFNDGIYAGTTSYDKEETVLDTKEFNDEDDLPF
jgi:predicted P-loop ATPase